MTTKKAAKKSTPKQLDMSLPEIFYIVMEADGDSVYAIAHTSLDEVEANSIVGTYELINVGTLVHTIKTELK